MPRQAGVGLDNSFIKGLITEATGLNFPENACTDTLNCRFNQTGLINRRKGFNFELQHDEHLVDRDGKIIIEYVWKAVAGTGNINFVVTQIGSEIFFYEVDPSSALSPGLKSFSIDL